MGTAPTGTAPMGTAPMGTAPMGSAPTGTLPAGFADALKAALLKGLAGTAPQEPSASIDESFPGLAKAAMGQARETQGIAYLAADAVVSGNEEVLGSLRWSTTLKRPVLAIRWGLATLVLQPTKAGEARARGEGPSAGAGGSPISITPGNIFGGATGGVAIVQPAAPSQTPVPAASPAPAGARAPKKRPGENLGPEGKAADYAIPDPVAFWRQNVGAQVVEALQTRLNRGDFGIWFKDSDKKIAAINAAAALAATMPVALTSGQDEASQPPQPPPTPQPQGPPGTQTPQAPANQAAPPLLSAYPGITLLEGSSLSDLRATGLRENLDFIIFAILSSKSVRSGPAQAVLEIHIVDICKGGDDWPAKPTVNHVRVMAAQQSTGKEKDKPENPLPALLKAIQLHIDRQCKLEEMPALEHEAVLKRAAALVAMKAKNPLPALLELRYYQWKKALSDQEFAEYAAKIAGAEDSRRLATGTDSERRQVVDQWLNATRKE